MYAYAKVDHRAARRPGAAEVAPSPTAAARPSSGGTRTGTRVRTEVQTGVSDGEWIEVTNRRIEQEPNEKQGPFDEEKWTPIDRSDQVLLGEKLSTLTEGVRVRLADSPPPLGEESTGTYL